MNFCVTDGETVIVTRYISSKRDEAASLVCMAGAFSGCQLTCLQWFSSGTSFSEYAEGGHYKMSKADKRENIIMVNLFSLLSSCFSSRCPQIASEPLTFERGKHLHLIQLRVFLRTLHSGLDGNQDEQHGYHHTQDELSADTHHRPVLCFACRPYVHRKNDGICPGERLTCAKEGVVRYQSLEGIHNAIDVHCKVDCSIAHQLNCRGVITCYVRVAFIRMTDDVLMHASLQV